MASSFGFGSRANTECSSICKMAMAGKAPSNGILLDLNSVNAGKAMESSPSGSLKASATAANASRTKGFATTCALASATMALPSKKNRGNVEYHVTKESLCHRLKLMKDAASHIPKRCRVLTIHGSEDEVVPVNDAHQFAKVIANHKLIVIEGANHIYANHQKDLTDLLLRHVKITRSRL